MLACNARADLRTDPISRMGGEAGFGARGTACGVGGRLCKRGWAHAKRVDARAIQRRRPAPLIATLACSSDIVSPASAVKAEKGTFRKRESEIYIFTFVMKFDDLAYFLQVYQTQQPNVIILLDFVVIGQLPLSLSATG